MISVKRALFYCCFLLAVIISAAAAYGIGEPPQTQGFSFAVFGDYQGGDKVFSRIINSINADKDISLAVCVGDFTETGVDQEYQHYIKLTKELRVKVYNAMGNHDGLAGGWRNFSKYFGPDHYSFDHLNSHFIVLNNAYKESFTRTQYNWLVDDLKKNDRENIFIFFHKPVFDPSGFLEKYIMSDRQMAENMMALFKRYKVDYVFFGHLHGYARAERDGVNYILTAGAGAPLYLPKPLGGFHHYVKMTVKGDKISSEVVQIYE